MPEFKAGSFLPCCGERRAEDRVRNGVGEEKIETKRNQSTQSEVNGCNQPSACWAGEESLRLF